MTIMFTDNRDFDGTDPTWKWINGPSWAESVQATVNASSVYMLVQNYDGAIVLVRWRDMVRKGQNPKQLVGIFTGKRPYQEALEYLVKVVDEL